MSLPESVASYRQNSDRWKSNLKTKGIESGITGFYGIMARACEELDFVLSDLVRTIVFSLGSAVEEKLAAIIGGKPIDRLTFGQYVQIIDQCAKSWTRHVREHHAEISYAKPLLGRKLISELHALAKSRNDFAHRRFPAEHDVSKREVLAFLSLADKVCDSDFVKSVIRETSSHPSHKSV